MHDNEPPGVHLIHSPVRIRTIHPCRHDFAPPAESNEKKGNARSVVTGVVQTSTPKKRTVGQDIATQIALQNTRVCSTSKSNERFKQKIKT
jgi:hypothetical protein